MQHPDEGMIHAWLDGELAPEEATAVEAHATECAGCAAAIAEARGLVAASSRIVSALDAVPTGVIPTPAWRTVPWYARTQLRAAAAVIAVAGATLLVARERPPSDSRLMQNEAIRGAATKSALLERPSAADVSPLQPAPAAGALSRVDKPTVVNRSAAREAAPRGNRPFVQNQSSVAKERESLHEASVMTGAGAPATSAPVPTPSLSADAVVIGVAAETDLSRRVMEGKAVGVGAAAAGALRIVSVDTAIFQRRTVYVLETGTQVILTERDPVAFRAAMQAASSRRAVNIPAAPLMYPPPPSVSRASAPPVNSISWTDSVTGRSFVLTGPLSTTDLEVLKARILLQRR